MQRLTGDDKQLLHQDRWDQVKSLGQGNEEEKEEKFLCVREREREQTETYLSPEYWEKKRNTWRKT